MFRNRGAPVNAVSIAGISPDPGDDKFIACALADKSDFLVTGNKRHFPQPQLAATKVVTAGEFIEFITLAM